MSYIAKNENKNDSFLDLKFNMEMDEAIAVAGKVRNFFEYDSRTFFFLSSYFMISFNNL